MPDTTLELSAALAQMQAELQMLQDKLEIRELTARYNNCFDDGDAEGYAATFTENGMMVHEDGSSHGGREAFIAACRLYDGQIVHSTTDARIEVDGDRATQICTFVSYRRSADRSRNEFSFTGRYYDELERTPDGWRFVRRRSVRDRSPSPYADITSGVRGSAPRQ